MEKIVTFPNGQKVCAMGQGTWNMGKSAAKRDSEIAALRVGIELGMRVVDTAELYENEEMVGRAIDGLRDRVFLVSKVLPSNASVRGTIEACERSLRKLDTEYLDLYLLHWGGRYPFEDTVEAMNRLVEQGKITMWGVSNMDVAEMERFLSIPRGESCAANQVAYNLQTRGIEYDLLPWSLEHKMPVMAYSPIGEGKLAAHRSLAEVARRHNATPAQIALAWVVRNPEVIAIPKSGTVDHVRDNFESLSIHLTEDDLCELNRTFGPPTSKIPLVGW